METSFLYLVGEALAVDVAEIIQISYPCGKKNLNRLIAELNNGQKFEIIVNKLN